MYSTSYSKYRQQLSPSLNVFDSQERFLHTDWANCFIVGNDIPETPRATECQNNINYVGFNTNDVIEKACECTAKPTENRKMTEKTTSCKKKKKSLAVDIVLYVSR